ncbi:MAG: stage II sporulation protein M [Prevotella sp.]|nr:stage II sporulation protein M [Prevotella sp.]
MKEITFIRNNFDKWRHLEEMLADVDGQSPADLADMYVDLTADLAFAQSHYPKSRITLYLNNLSSTLHNEIYKNKHEKWSRLLTFWTREVPLTMYQERKMLLISFLVFVGCALIGVISQMADPEFVRVILGDSYVEMTLENIANGKPMDVYNGGNETDMFLGITLNNVWVSFQTFILGIFTSLGTCWALFNNGIMMGSFEAFFYQHGLLGESLLAVFLHGTLEISAIIVAGAAGIALGNSWLFPGTYSRIVSFQRGAKRGLKIIVGTVPIFVVAGFIEGFLTRHTEVNDWLRLAFILLSLAFVIFYFIVYPRRLHNKNN